MIRRVHIENFRSIENCTIEFGNLCAFVGENNAGKSNILEALRRVLGERYLSVSSFSTEDHHEHDDEKDIVIELTFDPPLSHKPFAYGDAASIPTIRITHTKYKRATADAGKGDPRLDVACLNAKGKPVQALAEAPKKGQQNRYRPLTSLPRDVRDQLRAVYLGTDRSLQKQLPSARYSALRRMLEEVDKALDSAVVAEGDEERPTREVFAERLQSAFDVLRIPEFEKLEELLREHSLENLGLDPKADADRLSFRFGPFEALDFFKAIRLLFKEGDLELDALQMGHGAQNALTVAIFQAYEKLRLSGAIFLIEEPEMFLQPHRRRFFRQTLEKIAERNQVIFTTHSADFVTVPDFDQVRIVDRPAGGYTQVRSSTLTDSDKLKEKFRKELGVARGELFFARHVILVEGDTERLALPVYAERLGVNLDREGASVIEVSGKRNLPAFAELVKSFGIELTVVFDTDASDFRDQRDQEAAFNDKLRALVDSKTRVVELQRNYEDVVRTTLGEERYQQLCQQHQVSKAIRGRLIALEVEDEIPAGIASIFDPWTSGT